MEKINALLSVVGWSKRQGVFFLLVLSAFILVPLVVKDNALNNALVWLTGIVVLLYTVETYGQRLETARQNDMAIQPLVMATIEQRREQRIAPTSKDYVVLKNIGRGTALHIQVN